MKPYLLEKIEFFSLDSPLLKFSKNIASQFGEDGIIEKIFEILGTENQYCIEFGGWDGKYLSNCFNLIENKGWSGCFIEANKERFLDLVANHGFNPKVNCINKFVEISGENSLETILSSINAPRGIDLLSIDIDGLDYFIWEELTTYTPRLVVIEFNPTIPNDIVFVQPKNPSINQGSSLLALIHLGKKKGYELVCCTTCNAFFVKKEDFLKFKLKSNSILSLYRPISDGRIFHGFDSYIYVHGMDKLLWSKILINNDSFQVVSKEDRIYTETKQLTK